MFAITPFTAEREQHVMNGKSKWLPVRVIGITNDDEGAPAYICENGSGGLISLTIETYLRKLR